MVAVFCRDAFLSLTHRHSNYYFMEMLLEGTRSGILPDIQITFTQITGTRKTVNSAQRDQGDGTAVADVRNTMKTTEEDALFAGRIRDLARRAEQNDYLTHTGFLSLSEQSRAAAVLEKELPGTRALFYGGAEEADRKVLYFLPSYLEAEEMTAAEQAGEGAIACLEVRVRGARFTREIGHRDCLGALMHLGFGREQIGDILISEDGACAYIFALASMKDHICRELSTIGRAHVDLAAVPPSACTVRPVLVPHSGSIASVRIDSLVAMVFHLSRSAAQELVSREEIYADGRTVTSSSYVPPAGCRISVRGYGKFIFEGEEKTTKKGRILVRTSVFS